MLDKAVELPSAQLMHNLGLPREFGRRRKGTGEAALRGARGGGRWRAKVMEAARVADGGCMKTEGCGTRLVEDGDQPAGTSEVAESQRGDGFVSPAQLAGERLRYTVGGKRCEHSFARRGSRLCRHRYSKKIVCGVLGR